MIWGLRDNNPTVSVVIPCFNYGKYVESAIDSCLASTFQNIEIIVVNDGSTDPLTIDLLKSLNKPKTRVIHQPNQGLPAARNRGISEAGGTYILPLDADDMIGPAYIEQAVHVLESKPKVGFVTGWYKCFGDMEMDVRLPPYNFYELLFINIVCVCSLFRKKAWKQAGGYNENMTGYADWDFWISLGERGWLGHTIPEFHFYYRKHGYTMFSHSRMNHEHLVLQIRNNHPKLYNEKNLERIRRK